jgi:hypothetical protein
MPPWYDSRRRFGAAAARILLALSCCGCILAQKANTTQTVEPKPQFSITIVGLPGEVRLGAPLIVRISLTNNSESDMRLGTIPISGGTVHRIPLMVRDSSGKLVPKTEYGKRVHGESLTGGVTVFSFPLEPGKTFREESDLSTEFSLTTPGKYTVQAERLDAETHTIVKSDVVTVSIVR